MRQQAIVYIKFKAKALVVIQVRAMTFCFVLLIYYWVRFIYELNFSLLYTRKKYFSKHRYIAYSGVLIIQFNISLDCSCFYLWNWAILKKIRSTLSDKYSYCNTCFQIDWQESVKISIIVYMKHHL